MSRFTDFGVVLLTPGSGPKAATVEQDQNGATA
jgi:hypothetical protein